MPGLYSRQSVVINDGSAMLPPHARKRARLVCIQCHNHKLRCDRENRVADGLENCSNCAETGSFCQQRPSKPRRRRINGRLTDASRAPEHSYPNIRPAPMLDEVAQPFSLPLLDEQTTRGTQQSSAGTANPPQHLSGVTPPEPPPSIEQQRSGGVGTATPNSRGVGDVSSVSPSTTIGYLGDGGILKVFEQDVRKIAASSQGGGVPYLIPSTDLPPPELQQSFIETYFEYCWPWCPVLDRATFWEAYESAPSALLINALSLLGSRIRPPLIEHATAGEYYNRAKMLFYTDQENSPIVCLQAIMLFYWWAPRGPSVVHKDAAWWWTGLAIKYAQQMGLHREPKNTQDVGGDAMQSLRRRIWWTLFARERLTSICQSRPCTINPEDCNVREPTFDDFDPVEHAQAEIFIYWVRLCAIIGRVGRHLRCSKDQGQDVFPTPLAEELITWVSSLPTHLHLPITASRSHNSFDRNVYKLHLPYLTTITILHLNFSAQHPAYSLPEAYTAAILAASRVAYIFKSLLARGQIRFLGAIATWYVGVAIVALLYTQRLERLAASGADDIRILRIALNELAIIWPSAAVFVSGFERLRAFERLGEGPLAVVDDAEAPTEGPATNDSAAASTLLDLSLIQGINWEGYFPNIDIQTGGLTAILLAEHHAELLGDISWLEDPTVQLQNFFDPFGNMPGQDLESLLVD